MRRVISVSIVVVGLLIVGAALFGAGWEARGGGESDTDTGTNAAPTQACRQAAEDYREAAQTPGITEAQLEILETILEASCDE